MSSFSERWVRPDVGTFINFIDGRAVNNPNSSPDGPDRQAGERIFAATQWVPTPLDETFAFFADAFNLERITPPLLRFRIVTPAPIRMRAGTLIDYRLRLRGLPVRWRTEITEWEPPHAFTDTQLRGPYRKWVHRHDFRAEGGGTRFDDTVVYAVPGGRLVDRLIVRPDLTRIFEYRRRVIGELLGTGVTGAASQSL